MHLQTAERNPFLRLGGGETPVRVLQERTGRPVHTCQGNCQGTNPCPTRQEESSLTASLSLPCSMLTRRITVAPRICPSLQRTHEGGPACRAGPGGFVRCSRFVLDHIELLPGKFMSDGHQVERSRDEDCIPGGGSLLVWGRVG